MPCGGIIVMAGPGKVSDFLPASKGGCWICNRGGCQHFIIEWDAYIHARCALEFLKDSEEGECIIEHKHQVFLNFSLEET